MTQACPVAASAPPGRDLETGRDPGLCPRGGLREHPMSGGGPCSLGPRPFPCAPSHTRGPCSPEGGAAMCAGHRGRGNKPSHHPPQEGCLLLTGTQSTPQTGVRGLICSVARKFHLISCLISLPLAPWNFPSLGFAPAGPGRRSRGPSDPGWRQSPHAPTGGNSERSFPEAVSPPALDRPRLNGSSQQRRSGRP